MDTYNKSLKVLPVSVRYRLTMPQSLEAVTYIDSLAMPAWKRISLTISTSLVALVQILKNWDSRNPRPIIIGSAILFAVLVLAIAYERLKRKRRAASLVGLETQVTFHESRFEMLIARQYPVVKSYAEIEKIARNDKGMGLIVKKAGSMWIPLSAFGSVEERDCLYRLLGDCLR